MSAKMVIMGIILTIAAVGQVILSFVLYNKDGNSAVINAGWVVLWVSAIFGWLPIFTFRKWGGVSKGRGYIHTTVLVDRGVYAIVRHPQYLAGILMGVALTLIAQHWIVAVFGAISIVVTYVNTFEEEKDAIIKFGEDYKRYMESVPRVNFVLGIVRLLRQRGRH
jgi:protein-S-isoprenylcysteine O-methyltransferase Ste14